MIRLVADLAIDVGRNSSMLRNFDDIVIALSIDSGTLPEEIRERLRREIASLTGLMPIEQLIGQSAALAKNRDEVGLRRNRLH